MSTILGKLYVKLFVYCKCFFSDAKYIKTFNRWLGTLLILFNDISTKFLNSVNSQITAQNQILPATANRDIDCERA